MNATPFTHHSIKDHRNEVKDDYDHMDDKIEYVIENVLFERRPASPETVQNENLAGAFNSVLLNSCCCSSGACGTSDTCPHGGNYILSPDAELVLNPDRRSKDLIYECSMSCKCNSASCLNKLVQYGPRLNLEIIASKMLHKQYSLRTNAPIPRGAFVCEYAGELLTREEAQRRTKHLDEHGVGGSEPMDSSKMNYILCLNEYSLDGENASASSTSSLQQTFVDPRFRGNIGRYLNHSCQPNCEIFSVRVDCPIPKIAIFAKRDIDAGEELCFHYGGSADGVHPSKRYADAMQVNKSTPCLCGASNCEKFLPNLEF